MKRTIGLPGSRNRLPHGALWCDAQGVLRVVRRGAGGRLLKERIVKPFKGDPNVAAAALLKELEAGKP